MDKNVFRPLFGKEVYTLQKVQHYATTGLIITEVTALYRDAGLLKPGCAFIIEVKDE